MPLAKFPKPNYLRVQVTLHKVKTSKLVALSYHDADTGIRHFSPWCKSQGLAEHSLKCWFRGMTGIGRISFVVTEEILQDKPLIQKL